jgi:hypothetical protein
MVEILNYETIFKNKTIGYVDIKVPILKPTALIFRKISHVQNGGRRWFNLPTFLTSGKNEKPDYLKFVEFEIDAFNKQLLESLAYKVKEFRKKSSINFSEAVDYKEFVKEETIPF